MRGNRLRGAIGIAAFAAFNIGWIAGDIAQPGTFSPANDDISDLGAVTATAPWLYNQIAANLSGLLVVALGVALWQALAPRRRWFHVLGTAAVVTTGIGTFLDGLFRLDCQGIDAGCVNDSWHAHAHKIESGVTAASLLLALLLLPFVLRRIPGARWKPLFAAIPLLLAANVVFSAVGDGAATRAGSFVAFAALAYAGWLVRLRGRVAAASSGEVVRGESQDG